MDRGVGRSKYGGNLREELEQGEWDKKKMIRSFGRVGCAHAVKEVGACIEREQHVLTPK